MKTVVCAALLSMLASITADAARLKIYQYPKQMSAGEMVIIYFENPDFEADINRSSCTAEKLIAMVKQDVPILRIDQKGKQVYTSLGSYRTLGDTAMAVFMCPVSLVEGDATLYIINNRDVSVPYSFTVRTNYEVRLLRVDGAVKPLEKLKVVGTGFMPSEILDVGKQIEELILQVQYDKLSKADQFQQLNKRIQPDWDRVPTGNFLHIEQGSKKWRVFVEDCGMMRDGLTLTFTAPPDLTAGQATLTLSIRKDKTEVGRSNPLTVTVQ